MSEKIDKNMESTKKMLKDFTYCKNHLIYIQSGIEEGEFKTIEDIVEEIEIAEDCLRDAIKHIREAEE